MDIEEYVKENPAVAAKREYAREYYLRNRDRILGHKPSVEWAGKSPEQRFWAAVKKSAGCWEWSRGGNTLGYGILSYKGRKTYSHRFSWMLHNGPIPENLFVCHRCDNPKCVNPKHLFLGTQSDNMSDCARKGRAKTTPKYGEKNGSSKLTSKDVVEIRKLIAYGKRRVDIAKRFKVSETLIGYIKIGKIWGHLK